MITESQRLTALASYEVLDTDPEAAFDDIVQVAAEAAGCTTGLVGLLDTDRQWFKARWGLDAQQAPREQTFCEHVLRADAPVVVTDAATDPRFAGHPAVTGAPFVRFYAGFPLRTPAGAVLGTLCVLDDEPRPDGLTPSQERLLTVLAGQVMAQLELRRTVSDQARVVGELRLAVEAYRALAEHATDVVSRHLPDGTTLDVSPSVLAVLGAAPAAVVGSSALRHLHPRDAPGLAAARAEVLAGRAVTATVRCRHADGTWRHLEARLSPVRDDAGSVVQVHSVARDVTERVRTDELLRLSESRFRLLFDANPVGQVELSPTGVVQRVNQAFADLLGVDPAALVGRTPDWATADPHRPAQQQALLQAAAEPGTVLHSERTLHRVDGEAVEVAGTLVGVPDRHGGAAVLIGSVIDVTERNASQRRLAELAAELQAAYDESTHRSALTEAVLRTVGVGIVACDADGRLTLFNQTARDFHGVAADPGLDPTGWADRYALYAEDGVTALSPAQIPLWRALAEGTVQDAVIVIAPAGLAARTVRCDGRAMHDPAGRLLGAVVAMSDITEARAVAAQLAERAEYTRVLLETAHGAIYSCDTTGRPTYVNPTAQTVLGWPDLATLTDLYDRGELAQLASSVTMIGPDGQPLPPQDRPLARALAGYDTGDVEVHLAMPGRPGRTLLLHASPLRDSHDSVSGALLTGHDVTDLRASEARFRAAFHDGPTPVARLDRDGLVVEANPALRRLTAQRSDALVGRPLSEHVAADDVRRLHRTLAGPGTGAEPVEVRLLRADGTALWCELATTVSTDTDGTPSVLAQFLDVDARKTQESSLEQAAFRDPLTRLANRSRLVPSIQALLGTGPTTTAGLLFIDLDGFKAVNDRHGHEAGDVVLVEAADRLVAHVRPDDTVLRLGGDEFVVVCPVTTDPGPDPLAALAARLERAIAAPIAFRGSQLTVTSSIGTACATAGQSPQQLIDAADRAMYRRKRERGAPGQPSDEGDG